VAAHRRELSRTEEVLRLAGALLFALLMVVGLWLGVREVVDGNYASLVTALVAAAAGAAWTTVRRRRGSGQ
jgi:hypothetical protein